MYSLASWTITATILLLGGNDISQAIKKDRAALQGTWKVVISVDNGEKVPPVDLKGLFLIFRNDSILIREGDKMAEKFTYLLEPTRKPKEMDLTFQDGPKKGQSDRAIYSIEGDQLRICIQGDKDAPRPEDFRSLPASNRWLVILQRVKE